MQDPKGELKKFRISRICEKLQELWEHTPNQRLGQLISNILLVTWGKWQDAHTIFYTEDEEWESSINAYLMIWGSIDERSTRSKSYLE